MIKYEPYKIINGDMLNVLSEMEPNSVDVILTDPPYKDEDVPLCKKVGDDGYEDYNHWFMNVMKRMKAVAKDYVIFFNNASRLSSIMFDHGKPYRILVWTKGVIKYAWRWEPILIYDVGADWKMNKHIWSDHLPYQPLHKGQAVRLYEKPLKLMHNLVRYIPEDKTILDPFCGSGQTVLAAKMLGRQCMGVELDPEGCRIAEEKLRNYERYEQGELIT
jgi:site-specific DNA-methyltransferase (adenine-specific)